jgi:hypothetical protein
METLLLFVGYAISIAFLILLTVTVFWTATDAEKRGKSPLLVCLFVILTFPVGLSAWVMFRPKKIPTEPFSWQTYRPTK